jgi:hypothetical protein
MADIIYIEQGYYQGDNYYTYTADAAAALNSECTISCTITNVKTLACDFQALFTPALSATILKNHTAVLDCTVTLLATISKTVANQSTLDTIVTLSLQGDRSRALDSTLSSAFTQSTQIQKILNASSTLNTQFTINVDGDVLGASQEASATLTAEFTQSTQTSKTAATTVSLNTEFTVSVTAQRFRGIEKTFIGEVTIFTEIGLLQNATCDFATLFTPTVTCVALRNHTAVLDSVSSLGCVINKTVGMNSTLNTEFGLNITVNVFRTITITVNPAFTHTIDAVKTVSGVSTINSTSTVTILEQKIKNAQASISSQTSLTVTFITFVSKWFNHSYRPLNLLEPAGAPGRRIFSTSIKKFGSHSLGGDNSKIRLNAGQGNDIDGNFTANDLPAIFGINDDIYKDLWMRVDDGENFTRRIWDFSFGPALGIYNRKLYLTHSYFLNNQWNQPGYGSGTQPGNIMTTQLSTGTFHHVAYIYTASQKRHSLYVNGTRVITSLPGFSGNAPNWYDTSQIDTVIPVYFDNNATFAQYYDDMKWFRNYTFGYTANDTTIAVPSTEYIPLDNVYTNLGALYRFNDNYLDTLDVLLSANANFSVVTTVTVTADKSVSASATLNNESTVSALIGKIQPAAATLNSSASLSTIVTKIKTLVADLNADAQFSASINKTTGNTVTINSAVSISCDITRIKTLQSEFTAVATNLAVVARIGQGLITMDSVAQITVTANRTAAAESNLNTQFGITITAERIRFADFSFSVISSLNAVNSRIRATNSSLNVEFAVIASNSRIRSISSTHSSEFSIICEPLPIKSAISNQSAQFVQTTIEERIRNTTATFNTIFTQQSSGIIAVDAVADLNSEAQCTITVLRIRPGVVQMDAIAVNLTAAAKTGAGLVTIESQSQCTVTAQKTTDILLNAASTAQLTSVAERIQQGAANINGQFTQIANGILSTDVTANLNTVFSTTTTAQKTVRVIANITSAGGFVMAIAAIRNGEIIMVTQTNIVTSADRRRNTGANFTNSFTVNILAGVLAVANSVQNTQFAIIATVSKLRLDDIVLYIKTESRTHRINNEQRSYALRQENRLYTIEE